MLAIIGSYRGHNYLPRLHASLADTHGITERVIVDDSPHPVDLTSYADTVIQTGGAGYKKAMATVCEIGAAEPGRAIFIEEDFTIHPGVNWAFLGDDLDTHPQWAQIVLLRQAWYDRERKHGFFGAVERRGHEFTPVDGYLEHDGFFSCNPAVWRQEVFASGWPNSDWSEGVKGGLLTAAGYRFAITPHQLCTHDGIRTGHGY